MNIVHNHRLLDWYYYSAKCSEKLLTITQLKASIAIQVLPVAANPDELLRIVDEVIAYIKSSGLHCHVGPFETTIEGDAKAVSCPAFRYLLFDLDVLQYSSLTIIGGSGIHVTGNTVR